MKYSQTLVDDEYESSNIASQKELGSISEIITLGIHMHLSATNQNVDLIVTDTIKV